MKKCLRTISKPINDLYNVSNQFKFSNILNYSEDPNTLNYISTLKPVKAKAIKNLRIFKIVERNKRSKDPEKFVIYPNNNMPGHNIVIYGLSNLQRHNFNLKEVSV